MDEHLGDYIESFDQIPDFSSENGTTVNSDSVIDCECIMQISSSEHSEIDIQSSLMSEKSGSEITPKMDIENNSHLESLVDIELEVTSETVSATELEIFKEIDNNIQAVDIDISNNYQDILVHNLPKEELQISTEATSMNSNPELQIDMISQSSTNSDLPILTNKPPIYQQISDTEVTSVSLPGLEGEPSDSKEFIDDEEVGSSKESNKHSRDVTSIPHTYDDLDEKTTSPYEVYARHIFQTPIPPPRHKKKLNLDQNTAMDSEELEIGITPKSKRLCRYEDIDSSDLEVEYPSLDAPISMETANMLEEIPAMDTTLYIDASPTMDTDNSISSAHSYESISDVESDVESLPEIESLPDIPISFSSTRRPLMFPGSKKID